MITVKQVRDQKLEVRNGRVMQEFIEEAWFQQLSAEQQLQVRLSLDLYKRESEVNSAWPDYSFIIFPLAKAYEGFLKSYFFSLGFIDKQAYEGTKFRIGRALNPDVSGHQKNGEWVYDNVTQVCGAPLARELWDAWLECRNRVFHFYPEKEQKKTLPQAKALIDKLITAMKDAVECKTADDEKLRRTGWQKTF